MRRLETYSNEQALQIIRSLLTGYNTKGTLHQKKYCHEIEVLTTLLYVLTFPPCNDCQFLQTTENARNGRFPFMDCLQHKDPYHMWEGHFPTEKIVCNSSQKVSC